MPRTEKNKPKFASKAPLENCRCQGDIVRKSVDISAIFSSSNNFFARKYVTKTVNTPKIADGNLIANSLKPNMAMEGTVA